MGFESFSGSAPEQSAERKNSKELIQQERTFLEKFRERTRSRAGRAMRDFFIASTVLAVLSSAEMANNKDQNIYSLDTKLEEILSAQESEASAAKALGEIRQSLKSLSPIRSASELAEASEKSPIRPASELAEYKFGSVEDEESKPYKNPVRSASEILKDNGQDVSPIRSTSEILEQEN